MKHFYVAVCEFWSATVQRVMEAKYRQCGGSVTQDTHPTFIHWLAQQTYCKVIIPVENIAEACCIATHLFYITMLHWFTCVKWKISTMFMCEAAYQKGEFAGEFNMEFFVFSDFKWHLILSKLIKAFKFDNWKRIKNSSFLNVFIYI